MKKNLYQSPKEKEENTIEVLECSATAALPGTVEKIRELQKRIEEGLELFHPLDVITHEGDTKEDLANERIPRTHRLYK